MKAIRTVLCPAFFLLTWAVLPLPAQQELSVDDYAARLPADTVFYVSWKNLDDFEHLRANNPLLRLIDSPEMKHNWAAIVDYIQRMEEYEKARRRPQPQGEEQPPEEETPSEQPEEESAPPEGAAPEATGELKNPFDDPKVGKVLSLFTNPGLLALLLLPPAVAEEPAASGQEPGAPKSPEPVPAVLFLYDTTGKEELLQELRADAAGLTGEVREYELEGIIVEEHLDASGKPQVYLARVGQWLVGGSQKELTEAWIRTLWAAPEQSLQDTSAYQRAAEFRDQNAQLEFFFNVAAFVRLMESVPVAPGEPVTPGQVVEALGLNRWSLVHFSFGCEAEYVRYQMALVQTKPYPGEETILGSSVPDFSSLEFAPEDAFSYSVERWNLTAAWNSLQSAVEMLVPPQQAHLIRMFQGMAEGLLGMPIGELAAAWGDEFAQVSFPVVRGDQTRMASVNIIRLRDREHVLTALQNLMPMVSSVIQVEELLPESSEEEDVVWFRFSPLPGEKKDLAALGESALVAALTPDWLLMSSDVDELRGTLERYGQRPSLRDNPVFQQVRSRLPAELSGLGFMDIERFVESGAAAATYQEFLDIIQQAIEEQQRQQQEEE
ncbi:MAG: hypothetical protein ACE5G6_04055, partial [Terriglobia bacterium]